MNNEWRTAKLSAVAETIISNVDKKTKPNEHPVLLCNYTDVYRNSFILADMDFMSATATKREIAKCSLNEGDVIITKDSEKYDDIGVPALVRENVPDLVCGYHLVILRPAVSEIDGAYLFYALSAKEAQQQFHSYANGMTRFGLRKGDIGLVEIPLPPLPAQRAISRVLGAFDDKIALNAKMNATLEAMARALFRAWFVDFEPVRAKQSGRWRRGETLPGMPAELYDLFPVELTATELGEAPAGWGIGTFGDIVSQSLDKEKPFESPDAVFSHFSIPAYTANKMPTMDKGSTIKSVKSIVKPDTVLLSRLNPQIPRVWLVDVAGDERAVCSTEFMVLSAKAPFRRNYIYFLGQTESFHTQVQSLVTGTIHQRSRAHEILRIQTLLPDASVLKAFDELVADFMSRSLKCKRESVALAAMRDTLLPRLLSGEVRVG